MDATSRPNRIDGLLVERTANELLAFNDITGEAHALNETAAIVWDLCDGKTTIAEMVPRVAKATVLPADQQVVELAVEELIDAGLVDVPENSGPTIGRRALITKLGLGAAAIAALPIVESIASVATPAAAGQPQPPQPFPAPTLPPAPTPTPTPQPTPAPTPAPTLTLTLTITGTQPDARTESRRQRWKHRR